MANAALSATTPTTISATYPFWAFQVQSIGDGLLTFGSPAGAQPPIQFVAIGTKFRLRSDGVQERSPAPGDTVQIRIPDLYAAAANPAIATALTSLLTAIQSYGTAQGAL